MKKKVLILSLVLCLICPVISFADNDIDAILNKERERISSEVKETTKASTKETTKAKGDNSDRVKVKETIKNVSTHNDDDNWVETDSENLVDNYVKESIKNKEESESALKETTFDEKKLEELKEDESESGEIDKRITKSADTIEKKEKTDEMDGNLTDSYGNVIENDKDSWVGEDTGNIDSDKIEILNANDNIDTDKNGIINVSISEGLELGKSNLKVVIVNSTYDLINMFIYYRNDYKEKMYLPLGKYKVNQVINLNDSVQDLTTNINEFTISKDSSVNLIISKIKSEKIEETKETTEIIEVDENADVNKKANMILLIIKIVFAIFVLAGIIFGVKKFLDFRRGN